MSTDYAQWPEQVEIAEGEPAQARVEGSEIHLTVINHSTVLLQVGGLNILTDPIYSERCSPVSWAGPKRVHKPGVPIEKLPKIDVILVSHDHYDHLDYDTIAQLVRRDDPALFLGLGVGRVIEKLKSTKVVEMDWWEKAVGPQNAEIHFVPVQHFSGRSLADRNSTLWGGFVVKIAGRNIYFGGDTGYAPHFRETRERLGAPDLALLPIGAYEPRDFMSYAHLNPEEAVRAHLDLKAKKSVGVHYGTFQLTAEKRDEPVQALEVALKKQGVVREDFLTPEVGKTVRYLLVP
jgi:L-ascorbate metabolism protein UlaG (beta-lactamase superfamily)